MKLERQKLTYRENQALISSPALSAALLLGKTRVEARYPEETAPQMSPPRPPHVELTLAVTTAGHCGKGEERGRVPAAIGSTWEPEVTLPRSPLVNARIMGSLSSEAG